jgi:hypothetical protein
LVTEHETMHAHMRFVKSNQMLPLRARACVCVCVCVCVCTVDERRADDRGRRRAARIARPCVSIHAIVVSFLTCFVLFLFGLNEMNSTTNGIGALDVRKTTYETIDDERHRCEQANGVVVGATTGLVSTAQLFGTRNTPANTIANNEYLKGMAGVFAWDCCFARFLIVIKSFAGVTEDVEARRRGCE